MLVRDIIVIGASAGGFEAVQTLASTLPPDLRGAIVITLHQHPSSDGILAKVLNRVGPLPAVMAEEGMTTEPGRIYVAPPDHHLLLREGFVQLSHGPKENLQRPSINVMFRSAAQAYRERVAGVLLTGLLDDGAAGLWEIQQQNGTTIVQEPTEAEFPSMPQSAIRGVNVQYIVRLAEMGPLLGRLTQPTVESGARPSGLPAFTPAHQACPQCGGVLTHGQLDPLMEYRCHIGHRFGLKSLIAEKRAVIERSMGTALGQSEELVALLRDATDQFPLEARSDVEEEIARRVQEQMMIRAMLVGARQAE